MPARNLAFSHWFKVYIKKESGFTLIELLVVIAIIAILATIGFSVYSQAQKTARDGKRQADVREISKALEQYYVSNNNSYPSALSGLTGTTYFQSGVLPTPPSPQTGNYSYVPCGSAVPYTKYALCATLENTSNGNTAAVPTDGCANPIAPTSNVTYYCVYSSNR